MCRGPSKLIEFQEAVVAAHGIPLIVRAFGATEAAEAAAALVVLFLAAYNSEFCAAIVAAGRRYIPPLIALLLAARMTGTGSLSRRLVAFRLSLRSLHRDLWRADGSCGSTVQHDPQC